MFTVADAHERIYEADTLTGYCSPPHGPLLKVAAARTPGGEYEALVRLASRSGRNLTGSRRPSASASRSSIGTIGIVPRVSNRATAGCWSPANSAS